MIKKTRLIGISLLLSLFSFFGSAHLVTAQEQTVWVPIFEQDYTQPLSGEFLPDVGSEIAGETSVTRSLDVGGYHWDILSPSQQYVSLPIGSVVFPAGYQYKIQTTLQLPDNSNYGCAGVTVGETANSFQAFLVCNDSTYGVYQNQDGQWTETVPFTKSDFEADMPLELNVMLNQGWADFYLADKLLDTCELGFAPSYLALFAQPLNKQATRFTYKRLNVLTALETATVNALGEGVPDQIARTIRLLQKKDRLPGGINGTYASTQEKTISLAKMGYFHSEMSGMNQQNLLLQSDIQWKSAYNRPDYKNSGCGFTFRAQNPGSLLQVYIALDGNIYLRAIRNGMEVPIISYNYANWSVEGSGTLTMAASDSKISVFYDQKLLGTVTDATWIASGDAGFTVLSGTNFETGITCSFTNNHLYQFNQ